MKRTTGTKLLALALCANVGLVSPQVALAEDIDIFLGSSAGNTINPRILIVLDNTSNWSRQSQQWPGGKAQGQSEVDAISTVINSMKYNETDPDDKKVSVGLMEYVTGGDANDDGGFIRSAIRDLTPVNVASFDVQLKAISGNINDPKEKRNSNTPYGNLMFDVFNYFAGANSYSPAATLASKADATGYSTPYSRFQSPLTSANTCGRSFVVFIGNPNASGPSADNPDNTARLTTLNGSKPPQIGLPNFETKSVTTTATVGTTSACYASKADAVAATSELTALSSACAGFTDGCKIGEITANDSATACADGASKYSILGSDTIITNVPLTTTSPDTKPYNADEWVRMMHDKGVPVPGTTSTRSKVTTYTIDVYNKQPNAQHTALLLSMANAGGGRYFAAKTEKAIVDALREIMIEIQAVNSSFASTSLPVNATNRSQNMNQVFIGMFRPDPVSRPRWFGNLKRYQLVRSGTNIKLADVKGVEAVNPLTGFVTPCARSWWTRDSSNYWENKGVSPDPASACELEGISKYSDINDGPFVEKGGAAQVVREGNAGTAAAATQAVNRKMVTLSDGAFADLTAATSGLDANLVNWIRGVDVYNEKKNGQTSTTRPSIHGDVIHSRPQPINYGPPGGDKTKADVVTVYYGANDGALHAVDAETGAERWSFVAPEFFSRLTRIRDNTTRVSFPGMAPGFTPTPKPKDYFFDGSIGVYQNKDNSKVWIFPSMRRGGRMLYGIDVTNPATPVFKWRVGCPNLDNDTDCTADMSGIGQTWSTPSAAFIYGHSRTTPVLVVGGGYDKCEDANVAEPACDTTKGGFIYILDANTGDLLRKFATDRSVAADIAMVDINNDGAPDYAYAADTGGSIYRVDFIDGPVTKVQRYPNQWTFRKVAATDTTKNRKFLFAPALLYSQNKVYVALGSGDREHPLGTDYPYDNVVNRFYVYVDNLATTLTPTVTPLDDASVMRDYTTSDSCTTTPVLPNSGIAGWFMDLNQNGKGEQTVTSALIAGGMVTFSTNRPVTGLESSCSTTLGEARGYWVNLLNASGAIGVPGACGGKRSSVFVGGGLPPSPVFANSVGLGSGTENASVVLGAVQKDSENKGGISTPIESQPMRPAITLKRKRAYTYTKGD
ncbi:pilus assembly protein [Massilia sp. GCM10020059]|uniref:PilY1 beta-propeller domain-containing protein n=1 Tax=Massilia agrisoli TaxID=2892444 RepID=A0ABS8IUL1_9BURK|nr:PilC/PilY family type IV pilus protein [Massilia agrisoli]MCC6072120.1 hypothetical protein [Massilia agrisoli]